MVWLSIQNKEPRSKPFQSVLARRKNQKIATLKSLSIKNLLQNPKECVIISLGCRFSGCIGVPLTLLCRATVLLYGSLPFLYFYYTAKIAVYQHFCKIKIKYCSIQRFNTYLGVAEPHRSPKKHPIVCSRMSYFL